MTGATEQLRRDAVAIYDAAKAGVDPERAVASALSELDPPDTVWLFAIGKAAVPMTRAALAKLRRDGRKPAGGVVVSPEPGPELDHAVGRVTGDHPLPGPGSEAAARAIEALLPAIEPDHEAWILISGGASSLIGAPIPEIPRPDFATLQAALFGAGLPIDRLNAARKRFSRLGAGRLLRGIRARLVRAFILSDVPSDDPIDIGSGPCEPDPTTAPEIASLLATALGADRIPRSVTACLDRVAAGRSPETPKPGDPIFRRRTATIVAGNRIALGHAAARARALGFEPVVAPRPIEGEAAAVGRAVAARMADEPSAGPTAWLYGGETTVRLGPDAGLGGRCQELALAAAEILARKGLVDAVVLAAGTDGRDGPTDAAGALIDADTWGRIARAGADPGAALARHDSHPALARAGALLETGPTGTNVMDLVIALRRPDQRGASTLGSR
jgi:glycerate-2-kinase